MGYKEESSTKKDYWQKIGSTRNNLGGLDENACHSWNLVITRLGVIVKSLNKANPSFCGVFVLEQDGSEH